MKTLSKKRFKLMCLTLMVLLLLTGCALLPTTISDLATGMDDTVTISPGGVRAPSALCRAG